MISSCSLKADQFLRAGAPFSASLLEFYRLRAAVEEEIGFGAVQHEGQSMRGISRSIRRENFRTRPRVLS
jgi:hypothetical protein